MSDLPLLSLVVWIPIFGGLLLLALSGCCNPRPIALAVAVITFLLSLLLYSGFDSSTAAMQFQESAAWIETFKVNYHLGVDGISVPLIILTTFTTVLVVLAGWEVIKEKPAQYMASFLIMEGLMNGVFCALDA
ncbi:MAG: NADH-quinone oxidoreductase subunit M, partial [Pseudomonadota bacterium]|nr:NADH-quinone oxidoreductase subunit M [Pseudomonadota bacterium]